jgi:hypothetical protein
MNDITLEIDHLTYFTTFGLRFGRRGIFNTSTAGVAEALAVFEKKKKKKKKY